jgi:hypothetical protein
VGVRVLLCGGLLLLVMVSGELHLQLLVRMRLPVLVGARLMLSLLQLVDIGLLHVGLMLPLWVVLVVMMGLLVGG